jgi:hypothetical protein
MEKLMEKAKGAKVLPDARFLMGGHILTNHLTAEFDAAGKVIISGSRARIKLPHRSGPLTFKFELTDTTGLKVRFSDFGAELGQTCPSGPGDNTGQITDLSIAAKKAEFTDLNTGDECTFGYTWFFSCDDPQVHPTFDPIVDNGGNR